MKNIEKRCVGYCPRCDSENINWHGSELHDVMVIYEATCNSCNLEFTEVYNLNYITSTYEE